jgi:hypothetical protein
MTLSAAESGTYRKFSAADSGTRVALDGGNRERYRAEPTRLSGQSLSCRLRSGFTRFEIKLSSAYPMLSYLHHMFNLHAL